MTVVNLKKELTERGLPTDGLKAVLVERLTAAAAAEAEAPAGG